MQYIKKLFLSLLPVLKYMIFSYLIIFIGYFIYLTLGKTDAVTYLNNYANYLLLLFNIVYIIYLLKKNHILIKPTHKTLPLIILGISYACFGNMLIFKINDKITESINIYLMIISSVIVGPLIEEIIYRNLLVSKLEKFNSKITTILLASIIFSISHVNLTTIIYTFFLGIILNTIYLKSKNLFYPLILHSSANLITLFLKSFNVYILSLSFILLIISIHLVKREYLLK